MRKSICLAIGGLAVASAAMAAGTPLDDFQSSVDKKLKKSICVCQDGGLVTRAGRLSSQELCASGTCSILVTCEVELFDATTSESAGTASCSVFETIAK